MPQHSPVGSLLSLLRSFEKEVSIQLQVLLRCAPLSLGFLDALGLCSWDCLAIRKIVNYTMHTLSRRALLLWCI